jgi:hypothetical protein
MIAGAAGKERARMAIIGRLDEQTNAVLIEPLARKFAPDIEPHTPVTEQLEQPTQTELQHDEGAAHDDEQTTLPVWLL